MTKPLKRRRNARAPGPVVRIAKKAITSDALDDAGKLNPLQGLPSGGRVRPSGKPSKIKIIDIKEFREKSLNLPAENLDLPKDTAAKVFKGETESIDSKKEGSFLITSEGQALGIIDLKKGSIVSLSRFSEPLTVAKGVYDAPEQEKEKKPVKKQALDNDTPIEGLPLSDLLEAHWDIHIMWTTKMLDPTNSRVENLTGEDLVNLHSRIADALFFRGEKHPHPPDNGLDLFSFDLERFSVKQPRHFQRPSSGGEIPLMKSEDPYLGTPPEDGVYKFVAQNHYAGSVMHTDFRLGFKPDEMLLGWEIQTAKTEDSAFPITSTKGARKASMDPALNLINWDTGEWAQSKLMTRMRPPHPWVWLDVQGKTAVPRPKDGFFPPGSGLDHPGVFYIVDRGEVEFGLQAPDFHEYFVKGEFAMNYRIVIKKVSSVSKNVVSSNLPPEDEHLGEDVLFRAGEWVSSKEPDPRPAVLTLNGPMPRNGFSALPKSIRTQFPSEFHYWTKEDEGALSLRNDLVDAISAGKVEIDFTRTFEKEIEKRSLVDAFFVVQKWTDLEDSKAEEIQVRIDIGRSDHLVVKCENSSVFDKGSACSILSDSRSSMISIEGELRPSHFLNTEKTKTYHIQKIDQGAATVMSLTDGFIRIAFKGDSVMKSTFDIRKQNDQWLFCGGSSKEEGTPEDFVSILKFDTEDDERLVTGIVLEPDEIDTQNDTIGSLAIKETAHDFLAKFNRESELGVQHQVFGEIGVKLVESFIAPVDMDIGGEKVKKGSWVITVKVLSDKVWNSIKSGDLTGFSIGGIATVA
jgi:hypothetical protein